MSTDPKTNIPPSSPRLLMRKGVLARTLREDPDGPIQLREPDELLEIESAFPEHTDLEDAVEKTDLDQSGSTDEIVGA